MKLEALLQPVSEAEPCGPDLNAAMDEEYDYFFDSAGRLPGFYMQPGVNQGNGQRSPDRVFDPASVDIAAENKHIDALLQRSRDLRLVVLQAQWEVLAGRIGPFVDAVEAVAGLLETFPDDVHPTLADGVAERRDALSDLANQITVVQALQFAGLSGGTEVTLRKLKAAGGEVTPMESEEDLSLSGLQQSLADKGNARKVDETHSRMLRLQAALGRIEGACIANATAPFTPQLGATHEVVKEILAAIAAARPDLGAATPEPEAAPAVEEGAIMAPPGAGEAAASAPAATPVGPGPVVANHDHARELLLACEEYYIAREPSSGALLLVTQARLLIGKSLIEALETLLPDDAGKAVVDFGARSGFALYMDRLRQLAQGVGANAGSSGAETPELVAPIENAGQALAAIRSVEDYFRRAERSSPVPMLLQKARNYAEKDFQALLEELIPRREES